MTTTTRLRTWRPDFTASATATAPARFSEDQTADAGRVIHRDRTTAIVRPQCPSCGTVATSAVPIGFGEVETCHCERCRQSFNFTVDTARREHAAALARQRREAEADKRLASIGESVEANLEAVAKLKCEFNEVVFGAPVAGPSVATPAPSARDLDTLRAKIKAKEDHAALLLMKAENISYAEAIRRVVLGDKPATASPKSFASTSPDDLDREALALAQRGGIGFAAALLRLSGEE